MRIIKSIIRQFDFNLLYASNLVNDVPEELMSRKPFPGFENHPAFSLGHLVSGSALMVEDLGGEFQMPEGWKELFLVRRCSNKPLNGVSDITSLQCSIL